MPLVELEWVFERLSACPIRSFEKGELALAEGTKTGRLLFLIRGAVGVVKDGWHIARIDKPGAVLGDMAALRDQPHSADVVVFQTSTFFEVKDAADFLSTEPLIALYIAGVQSERLDAANRSLIAARSQFTAAGQRHRAFVATLDTLGAALRAATWRG
jgi:CRP-like cAMP-binding protein